MKRILVIGLTEKMGGVETFIYNTTINSNKNKIKYDYLIHSSNDCVFKKEISEFYNDGENHFYFFPKFKKNPLKCIIELFKFYKKNKDTYDFIHLETGSTAEVVYVFPFNLFIKAKVITHSHNGNGYNRLINAIFKPIVNIISYKKLSCSNEATKWLFGKKYISGTTIINNGIDHNKFRFSNKYRKEIRKKYAIKDKKVIGHIGRFSPQKNHDFIIKLFEKIYKNDNNFCLLLVGVGELEDTIKEKVNQLGLNDCVIFAGLQMEAYKYYSAFDYFLMPSLYEGLPIVGIEAQNSGLVCLFSDTIDKDILITDRAYMIALSSEISEWTKKICSTFDNDISKRENYADIIDNKGYSINNTVKVLQKIYEEEI